MSANPMPIFNTVVDVLHIISNWYHKLRIFYVNIYVDFGVYVPIDLWIGKTCLFSNKSNSYSHEHHFTQYI